MEIFRFSLLGLGAEALRRRQRDVLGRPVRLGEDAIPDPLGRTLDQLDLGCFRHRAEGSLTGMASDTFTTPRQGILSDEMKDDREQLVELLTRAYWMEMETVTETVTVSRPRRSATSSA